MDKRTNHGVSYIYCGDLSLYLFACVDVLAIIFVNRYVRKFRFFECATADLYQHEIYEIDEMYTYIYIQI